MTNVYDMVAGQFIDDEPVKQTEQHSCNAIEHRELRLQLQPVENTSKQTRNELPADLAYQAFLLTE